jgi:hypothetical protein
MTPRVRPAIGKEELAALIEKNRGHLSRVAFESGVPRRRLYDAVYRHGLEPAVARARRAASEVPDWLRRTRAAVEEELLMALQGLTADEILDLLETSVHAAETREPGALAAYLAEQANLT